MILPTFITHQAIREVQFSKWVSVLQSSSQHTALICSDAGASQAEGARPNFTGFQHTGERFQLALFARLQVPTVNTAIVGHLAYSSEYGRKSSLFGLFTTKLLLMRTRRWEGAFHFELLV
jgi:hypothetical protein